MHTSASFEKCDDERWNEVRDTMDAIEDEVDELYKIVEGMDYI